VRENTLCITKQKRPRRSEAISKIQIAND
jgi:hypothetical protein